MHAILTLFGASDDALVYAYPYMMIYLLGTLAFNDSNRNESFYQCTGIFHIGMLSVAVGAVANIILDPVFLFLFWIWV